MRSMQEEFWSGKFGDDYLERNRGEASHRIQLLSRIMRRTENIHTICELGANMGLNLMALHAILPEAKLTGVEINQKAAMELSQLPYVDAHHSSIYDAEFLGQEQYDFIFTSGVLIHQSPDLLFNAYDILYRASRRYIMVSEYYNPTPVEVEYRGNTSVLFKRDFAGDLLDKYPDLELIDYGFAYHRDSHFKADDVTWFLMKKP